MKLTIIPGLGQTTAGSRVLIDDQELKGITKLVLTGEVNSIWKAEITMHPSVIELPEGIYADVTSLEHDAREYLIDR